MLSLRGTPCVYQGEELGQIETELEFDELTDPPGIRFWPENKGRDGCRTPMTWNHKKVNAGFTEAKPWLPIKEKQQKRSADLQNKEPYSVLNFYRDFINYRKLDHALSQGNQSFLGNDDRVLIFTRDYLQMRTLCLFNLTDSSYSISINLDFVDHKTIFSNADLKKNHIELNKFGFMIISELDIKDKDKEIKFNIR